MDDSADDLAELLRQAQAGNRAALNALLARLRPHLEAVAQSFADPAHPAESVSDLVQEAGLLAWKSLGDFRGGATSGDTERQLLAWLAQIVRHVGIDARRAARAQRRSPTTPVASLDAGATPSSPALQTPGDEATPSAHARSHEASNLIAAALARLDDEASRQIAQLVFIEGLSLRQVAVRLGLTYDQVRHRYHKLLTQLEGELKGLI
jgi:RNA polymerase sigma factor (sigma-70 family)